jgi:putative SOS response-associated peptidase YedK
MCGRFSLTIDDILKLANRFHVPPPSFKLQPHYNLAPSQHILTVVNWQGERQLVPMQWGLIPFWSRKSARPQALVNVRSENLEEKPIFKPYFERKRCLIPADSFFEWKKEGKNKIPFRAIVKNESIFSFAGLWDHTQDHKGNPINCFTILTTEANKLLAPIHDRMPVVLTLEAEEKWLDPSLRFPEQLHPLLRPFPASRMEIYEVSTEVNSTKHDSPECIAPVHH